MKKVKIIAAFLMLTFAVKAQTKAEKKDTAVQITISLDAYRALLYTIDVNIDSKKTSNELITFLQKSAHIVADKPKDSK